MTLSRLEKSRLRDDDDYINILKKLRAENAKLRAALEWVEQNSNEPDIAGYAGRAAALNEGTK